MSVLLTSYNHEQYIDETIRSVLAQTYQNFECIVIDDGSRDGSVARILNYGSRIRFLRKPNGGQASAINAGRTVAEGSLICFMDSDDVWEPTKIEAVVDAAKRAPTPGLIIHNVGTVDAVGVRDARPRLQRIWSGRHDRHVWRTGPWWPRPPSCGIAIPTVLFDRIAPIPEAFFRISPDAYVATLGLLLGPVTAVPEVLAYWRWHGENATRANLDERCRRQLQFLEGINVGLRDRLAMVQRVNPEAVWSHQITRYESGLPGSVIHLCGLALGNPAETLGGRVRDVVVVWREFMRRILDRGSDSHDRRVG